MTPWTVACQAPLSMGFSRQEYWSGLPFPSPGIFLRSSTGEQTWIHLSHIEKSLEHCCCLVTKSSLLMGGAVFPPCCLTWGQTMVEDNGDLLQKVPCTHCWTQCSQTYSQPSLTHASAGDSWTLKDKSGSVFSGVTAPFSWVLMCTRFCSCPPKVCFPSPV